MMRTWPVPELARLVFKIIFFVNFTFHNNTAKLESYDVNNFMNGSNLNIIIIDFTVMKKIEY